jgi:pimeloyl-ACP methyl ester carboxylesterase
MAIARPHQVRRLVLVGCAVYTEAERREQERWSYELEIPKEGEGVEQQVLRIVRTVERFRRVGVDDAMVERQLSEILRDRQYSSWAHVGVFAHDLAARLPLLSQPVLLINADDDLHGPTQRAPALLRNGRIVDLSPAGFGVLETEPGRCAELIRQFLDEGVASSGKKPRAWPLGHDP